MLAFIRKSVPFPSRQPQALQRLVQLIEPLESVQANDLAAIHHVVKRALRERRVKVCAYCCAGDPELERTPWVGIDLTGHGGTIVNDRKDVRPKTVNASKLVAKAVAKNAPLFRTWAVSAGLRRTWLFELGHKKPQ